MRKANCGLLFLVQIKVLKFTIMIQGTETYLSKKFSLNNSGNVGGKITFGKTWFVKKIVASCTVIVNFYTFIVTINNNPQPALHLLHL